MGRVGLDERRWEVKRQLAGRLKWNGLLDQANFKRLYLKIQGGYISPSNNEFVFSKATKWAHDMRTARPSNRKNYRSC